MSKPPEDNADWIIRPVAVSVRRFKCVGCRRTFASRGYATKHAAICQKIGINHGCKTCALFHDYEESSPDGVYPGCGRSCGAGLDISENLRVHCTDWGTIF
jgi:hypothetical protein